MGASRQRVLVLGADRELADALQGAEELKGIAVELAAGEANGLRRLRRRAYDVVVTSPSTSVSDDIAFLEEVREIRPGVSMIALAPEATPEEIIASLRKRVFAALTPPYEPGEVARLARQALEATDWRTGIEVLSATRDWISLRLSCRWVNAERLLLFFREFREDVPDEDRDAMMIAFREVLMNAMEHGAGFDPDQVIEISGVRTARTIVYYVRDPGKGFQLEEIDHAAAGKPERSPVALQEDRTSRGMRPGGFGILLAQKVVDELIFSERGNEVILIKHTVRADVGEPKEGGAAPKG
jgi:anti-sigma regulatory factor (Ser/Thr protein kinase)/ActR/RegA family two-component response regulator